MESPIREERFPGSALVKIPVSTAEPHRWRLGIVQECKPGCEFVEGEAINVKSSTDVEELACAEVLSWGCSGATCKGLEEKTPHQEGGRRNGRSFSSA